MTGRENPPRDHVDLTLLGHWAAGKTCLVRRMLSNEFVENPKATFIDYHHRERVKVRGQERRFFILDVGCSFLDMYSRRMFRLLREPVYVLVVDVHDHSSMYELLRILATVSRGDIGEISRPLLVGTKADLREEGNCIPVETLREFCTELSELFGTDVPYIEVSARLGSNIELLKEEIVRSFEDRQKFRLPELVIESRE